MKKLLKNIHSWGTSQIQQILSGGKRVLIFKIKKLFSFLFITISCFLFFPLFLFLRIISGFYLIRFGMLPSRRIGHFIVDVDIYLYNNEKKKLIHDFFYLEKPICNHALVKILKKKINIFSELLILPFMLLNKISLIGNEKHFIILNPYLSSHDLRDKDNLVKKINYFSKKNIEQGNFFLKNLGITKYDKYVCLLCRDTSYTDKLFKNDTYDLNFEKKGDEATFRNSKIENFKETAEFLIDKGYYVFRMGKEVNKPFTINNKKFIDYATAGIRSDFIDIFLSANCEFFLSTGAGLDSLASTFDRPVVFVSNAMVGNVRSSNKKQLTIFKHFLKRKTKTKLSLSEIFDLKLAEAESNQIFEEKDIDLVENDPNEIKEAVIDMLKLIKNNFNLDQEEKLLHNKFWKNFEKNINSHNYRHVHANFFKAHIGYSFLKKNTNFLK